MSNDLDQALAAGTDVQDVEDRYELSPTQEGMLLHTLREPRAALFFQQLVLRLRDPEPASFVKAWQLVVDRHPILRSSFHWEGFSRPVQIVHRSVQLPVAYLDWRDLPPFEQEQRLRRFLDEDRQRGFDLNSAPLLRLTLIRFGEADYASVKSHHHLVLDGWSGTIVLKEVQRLHRALQRGRKLALPQPRPYRDYIEWLGRQDMKAAEAFWRERLSGFMAPTPLPGERSTGARTRPAARFLSHQVTLSPDSTSALQHLTQRWRITLSTAVQGAWALLLSLWSGEEDVVFGVTVSGRPVDLEGVEAMVGLFINALPVRVRVSPQQPLEEWLCDLHARQRQLQQYEYSPPAQVQSWSQVPRGVPLFETLVTFNSESMGSGSARGAKAPAPGSDDQPSGPRPGRHELSRPDPTNQPLSLVVVEARGQLQMHLTADAHRYEVGTPIRLLEQLRLLLEGFTDAQPRKVGELSPVTPAELHQVTQGWNETEVDYPRQVCLHHLFEATVSRSPDRTAVLFEGQALSYAELNRRANRLAQYLRSQGVGPEVMVGLAVRPSLEMAVGLLAVLKAGGGYVPLDPSYPSARLAYIMEDSQAALLLTEENLAQAWRDCPVPVILLDRDQDRWRDHPAENPAPDLHPENLAFMVYTSGSTGTPKGVGVPHRVCVNRMHVEPDPLQAGDVLCAKTSISFIDSVWELFIAWTHGLPTVLVPGDQVKDPSLLVEAMAEAGVTRLVLVPSLLQALLDCGQPLPQRLPGLLHWISSGEPLPHDVSRRFAQQLPDRVLTNLYGTSETWDSTRCDSRQHRPEDGLPIGRPMGNCSVYVLDRWLRPVPVDVPGELFVGGAGLARGYHRRADLTAERFLPDPFSQQPGARLYRTGDRVRWLPDGQLEFLGRIGQQLKVRGFRVEPGEVEAVLRDHPDVHQAAIAVTPRQQLAAYIVPAEGRTPRTEELRELSRQRLPAFMVPDLFLTVERLPLTPSGKIDRRALPAPEADRQDRARPYRPPTTQTESAIATVWAAVLEVNRVGIEDNFFELGGHSLLATQVIARLRSAVGVKIPLHALFDAPTVAGLARWIDANRDNPDPDAGPPIMAAEPSAEAQRQAPQSFAQQRLWFLAQLAPGSPLYNTMTVIRLPGALDLDALERTLAELVRRHESLRTTFGSKEGEPIQLVAPPGPVRLPVTDLRPLPAERRQDALQKLRRTELAQPFDLARGPLVRFRLLRLEDRSQVLVLAMHHIITDGWSMGVLRREVHALYEAFRAGEPSPLPEPALQYADFAIWQRHWLQGTVLQAQLDYWKEKLAGASPLELPTDRPRPAVPRYASARQRFRIDARLTSKLRDLARQEESTPFMALLAAFQLVLSRYSGQRDVVVGTPIANRTQAQLEDVVGFFVNTLVLRTDVARAGTFRQLLRLVRQTCLEAYAHQDLPFENLVEELAPRRDLSLQPLIQVLFVLQNTPQTAGEPLGQRPVPSLADTPEEAGLIYFDLTLSLTETASELSGSLHFNTDLFDPGTAQRLVQHFQTLLAAVADHPDQELSSVSMLPARERRQLLSTRSRRPRPPERCIHQLVEDQVDRTPDDHPAVTFEGRQLSYRELDRRANQLAHRLRTLGVRPEVPVCLYLDRGLEAIVGLLGILKAGGVYVPLDPSLPRERLSWMLADVRPAVLLTQEALRPGLPEHQEAVLCLDDPRSVLRREPGSRPRFDVRPGQLAYIIYTSGSTGRPKGVMVEHRSLSHTITAQLPRFGVTAGSRVLATIALSFDASLGEIFRTLCAGATLSLARREELLPGPSLIRLLREERITMTSLVTPVLAALPVEDLPELRTLTVGGEALPAELAARWSRGRRLLNGYGPTEATIGATLARIDGGDPTGRPPLGTPLADVRAYVLDERMQLLPMGVPGELYLGGPGVARGYLGQPGLTAERFVPDPFGVEPGRRLYRTGDRVRWLPDGQLEFLGRVDEQVKVRGHRVEPGEVAAVLQQHARVREAAVVVRDHFGQHRLVAYVVPSHDQRDLAKAADELVGEWRQASEVAAMGVEAAEVADPRLNFAGWVSSYTGQPIPVDEMRQWADATVSRILRLGPREVLEIGSGTGLVMFRLAPHCRRYLGVDLSAGLLEQARRHLALLDGSACQIDLRQGRGDELDDLPDQSFDCVVLNSVVQYFPDVDYLLRVLQGAVRLVRPGGAVFVGDVRSLPLLDAFHASVQLSRAAATLPASRLAQLARRRRSSERELVLDPGLFAQLTRAWARLSHLHVLLKPGTADNELNRFRYDVVLHVEGQPVTELGDHWQAWQWESQEAGLRRLGEILAGRPARLGVQRVPNARTAAESQLVSWLESRPELRSVAELRRELAHAGQGVEPEALTSLGRELGYNVELSWLNCDRQGRYDVLFRRWGDDAATAFPAAGSGSRPWQEYANNPAEAAHGRSLTLELRDYLGERLPEYMVPSAFVTLDALPLTPHGKLDRRALPAPEDEQERPDRGGGYVAPRTPAEKMLADIWADLLGLERVGVHDNFFELGGDSILSIRVISRANQAGLNLTTQDVYRLQTVAEQAAAAGNAQEVVADQDQVTGELPLTPIQHWFLEGAHPEPHHFNWATFLPAPPELSGKQLRQVLRTLLAHHDALRLRIVPEESGAWRQFLAEVDDKDHVPLTVVDLSGLPPDNQRAVVEARAAELQASLNFSQGPLLRLAWFDAGRGRPGFGGMGPGRPPRFPQPRGRPGRLLLIVHHLAVDAISWPILLADLTTLLRQAQTGQPMQLPPKTSSFKEWAECLKRYAVFGVPASERRYWLDERRLEIPRLPRDHPDGANSRASVQELSVALTEHETRALQGLTRVMQLGADEVMLVALGLGLARWTGRWRVLVNVERHGREDLGAGLNLSRTVGWFANIAPMLLEVPRNAPPYRVIRTLREQVRAIPNRGLGYGLLRYLGDEKVRGQLREQPEAEVFFNYFGQQRESPEGRARDPGAPQPEMGPLQSPKGLRRHLIEINAMIKQGRLQMRWSFSANVHERASIERLTQEFGAALEAILASGRPPEQGSVAAEDLPEANLDHEEFASLLHQLSAPNEEV